MRKVLTLVLIALLVLGAVTLAGCGGKQEQAPQAGSGQQGGGEPAKQAEYPTKEITLVVHTAPGGGGDVYGRQLAKYLEPVLGKPVVVENRPGGSGATALSYVAKAAPDGYTLLALTNTLVMTPIKNKTPNTIDDLDLIAQTQADPTVLYVSAKSPYKTAQELLEAAKTKKMKWGAAQVGSPDYIALNNAVNAIAKGNIVMIPSESSAESMTQVLGGVIEAASAEPSEIKGQVEAGELRVLASFTAERIPGMDNVPTLKELGYGDDTVFVKFRGIGAPKGIPAEVKEKLEKALQEAINNPEYKQLIESGYSKITFQDSAAFTQTINELKQEYTAWVEANPQPSSSK